MQECGSLKNEGGVSNILRPQLVMSLFIVIPVHAVKVCNNYASALIIYKTNIKFSLLLIISQKNYNISNQTNSLALMENSKSIH